MSIKREEKEEKEEVPSYMQTDGTKASFSRLMPRGGGMGWKMAGFGGKMESGPKRGTVFLVYVEGGGRLFAGWLGTLGEALISLKRLKGCGFTSN